MRTSSHFGRSGTLAACAQAAIGLRLFAVAQAMGGALPAGVTAGGGVVLQRLPATTAALVARTFE